jgi:NADPH2:quinone reductase
VRVRVRVSAVNPTDYKARAATPGNTMLVPYVIPHQDGAGEIDAVGKGVDPARLGERVWVYFAGFRRAHGTAAQWVCLPERQAVTLPEAVSFDLGASLGIPALTAHRAVFSDGPVAGQCILVAGGAGAVGHFAIELARHAGARVIATVSSPQKAALAEAAGADLVIDYRAQDTAAVIRKVAADGVDRIVEVAPAANLHLDVGVISRGGTIVTYGTKTSWSLMSPCGSYSSTACPSPPAPGHHRGHERADRRRPQRAAGAPLRTRRDRRRPRGSRSRRDRQGPHRHRMRSVPPT